VRLLIPVTFAPEPSLRRFGVKKSDLQLVFSLLCAEIEKIPESLGKSPKIRCTEKPQTHSFGLRRPSLTTDTGEKYVESPTLKDKTIIKNPPRREAPRRFF